MTPVKWFRRVSKANGLYTPNKAAYFDSVTERITTKRITTKRIKEKTCHDKMYKKKKRIMTKGIKRQNIQ
jgi:hypothetical protein